MLKKLLCLMLFLLPTVAFADDDADTNEWYQVELIVFAHASADDNEKWPSDPGAPDMRNTIALHYQGDGIGKPLAAQSGQIDPLTAMLVRDVHAQGNDQQSDKIPTVNLMSDDGKPSAPGETPYLLLDSESLQLNNEYEKLSNAQGYKPLLHIGWRQPVPARNSGQRVRIDSRIINPEELAAARSQTPVQGNTNNESLAEPPQLVDGAGSTTGDASTTDNRNTSTGSESAMNNDSGSAPQTLPPPRIAGTLMITRGRYLHVIMDMLYRPEDTGSQNKGFFSFFDANPVPDAYRLTQQRRSRSSELNYFDHPKFGVLAIITPYELPDTTQDTAKTIPLRQNSQ